MFTNLRIPIAFATFCICAAFATAHPVPKDNHDRTIVVRLQKGDTPNQVHVRVEYRLEVDEVTLLLNDMKPFKDEVDPLLYRAEPMKYYAAFTRIYAPIYAERLVATVNDKPLPSFRCTLQKERLEDEDGKKLGHLRCDFVFESAFDLEPGVQTKFFFHDQTYRSFGIAPEPGQLSLSLVNETGLAIESRIEADEALRKHPIDQLEPEEEDRLRKITVVFAALPAPAPIEATPPQPAPREPLETHDETYSLLHLVLHNDYGFFLLMLLAFLFGAAHALTPGHGKTLVAAYLVGERGTIWHALFLGVVTTLTHTGSIMILALILTLLPDRLQQTVMAWIVNGLGLLMGLLVTCAGFWLLLQRVAGRADHVHVGGGHHHHHPSPNEAETSAARTMSWWGLIVLGVTGGMVPCVDAIVLLIYSVGTSRFWLVLPAILAFSAGLAVVLVLIGILVVQVPRFVESRFGSGRLLKALPIVSAVLVTLMGLWLCYEGVHGK